MSTINKSTSNDNKHKSIYSFYLACLLFLLVLLLNNTTSTDVDVEKSEAKIPGKTVLS